MIKELQNYVIQFLVLVLAQLLIFNNIEFSGYINPYVYILFILLLPFDIPSSLFLVLAFSEGFIIDLFSGTPGVHSSATVFMAFLRPGVLKLFAPREGYLAGSKPRLANYGFEWFVKYAGVLVTVHHFVLFYLEVLSFDHFMATFLRAFASSVFTLFIIVLSQFLIFRE